MAQLIGFGETQWKGGNDNYASGEALAFGRSDRTIPAEVQNTLCATRLDLVAGLLGESIGTIQSVGDVGKCLSGARYLVEAPTSAEMTRLVTARGRRMDTGKASREVFDLLFQDMQLRAQLVSITKSRDVVYMAEPDFRPSAISVDQCVVYGLLRIVRGVKKVVSVVVALPRRKRALSSCEEERNGPPTKK